MLHAVHLLVGEAALHVAVGDAVAVARAAGRGHAVRGGEWAMWDDCRGGVLSVSIRFWLWYVLHCSYLFFFLL